jgi:hypothetical protein
MFPSLSFLQKKTLAKEHSIKPSIYTLLQDDKLPVVTLILALFCANELFI